MKKVILSLGIMLSVGMVCAQGHYYVTHFFPGQNPGGLNTEDEQPSAYMTGNYTGYTEILAPGSTGWSSTQSLPFAFEFNGGTVDAYHASASGVVTFAATPGTAPTSSNTSLPSGSIPDSSVCAWGMNLNGTNDAVITKTFGNAPNRQHWIIWASASASGLSGSSTWTYWGIVLEETSNSIYVVDMRTYASTSGNVSLTVGVQVDGATAVSVGSGTVSSYTTATGGASDLSDQVFYEFRYGVQPDYDVQNAKINLPTYMEDGDATNIGGTIVNWGTQTITSVTISYSINGGTPVTDQLTGLSIAPATFHNFTLPTAWTAMKQQTDPIETQTVETEVLLVNGNSDADPSNNTLQGDVLVHVTPVPRKPLLEGFTSSTCGPCNPGNANVRAVMAAFSGQYSRVNYQMSWPGNGDPYFTTEGADRRFYYEVNAVPDIYTDGVNGINSNSYTASLFTDAQAVPAFINITVGGTIHKNVTYSVVNGQLEREEEYVVDANASLNPIIDLPSGLVAHMAIIENKTYDNVETNGETEFEYVLKKMLPNANGTPLSAILENDSFEVSHEYSFKGDYRLPDDSNDPIDLDTEHSVEEFDDLSIVAWVQTPGTKEVWQSENASIQMMDSTSNLTEDVVDGQTVYIIDQDTFVVMEGGQYVPLGVNSPGASSIAVYPNPANDVLNISGVNGLANVKVYDMSGRLVMNTSLESNAINVSELEAGVYQVVIETNDLRASERITISH